MDEKELIDRLIELALAEDIGDGDHSTLSVIPASETGSSKLIIKEEGVLAGVAVAVNILEKVDPGIKVDILIDDGSLVKPGDEVLVVNGSVRTILQTERLILNIMQRMSGIATLTKRYLRSLEGTSAKLLDTRKTTPGMRMLEKQAVKIAGGENHRIGLFDMILLKDNHLDFAGGVENAVRSANNYIKEKGIELKIEVEVRNFDELSEALSVEGVDRIMLDNFTPQATRQAVEIVDGRVELESSGGITLENIRSYAETGVDYISVGAVTHSVKSLDMSFKAVRNQND